LGIAYGQRSERASHVQPTRPLAPWRAPCAYFGQRSQRAVEAFRGYFSADRIHETGPASASEDFGSFGSAWHVPSVFWFVGGTDPDVHAGAKSANRLNEIPTNHNARFLPVLHPTPRPGVEALVVAACGWLAV